MNFDKIEEQLSDRLKDAAGISAKQELVQEGIIDTVKGFFGAKKVQPEIKKPLFNPYKDKQAFKILSDYLNGMYNQAQKIFVKIWAQYPEAGRMFSMVNYSQFQAEIINVANGDTTNMALVDYDIWRYGNIKKYGGARELFGMDKYVDEYSEIDGAMINWFKNTQYGKFEYTGDWDDGTFDVFLNMDTLKSYLKSKGVTIMEAAVKLANNIAMKQHAKQESSQVMNEYSNPFFDLLQTSQIKSPIYKTYVSDNSSNRSIVDAYFKKVFKNIEFQISTTALAGGAANHYNSIITEKVFLDYGWLYATGKASSIPIIKIDNTMLALMVLGGKSGQNNFLKNKVRTSNIALLSNLMGSNKYGRIQSVSDGCIFIPDEKSFTQYLKSHNILQESGQSVNDIIDQHFLEMKDQAIDDDPNKDLIAEDDDLVQEANHLKILAKHAWGLASDAGMFWVKAFKDIFGIKRSRSVTPKAVIREKPVRESIMAQYQAIYPELLKIVDQNIIIRPVINFKDHTSNLNINFINGTTNYITIADYNLWQHPAIGPSKEYDSSLIGIFTGGNVSQDIRTVTNNPMYVKALQKFYNTTKAIIEKAGIGEVGWEVFDGINGRLVIKVSEQKIQKMVNDYYSKVQEASIDSIVEDLAEPFGSDNLSKAKIKSILETVQKSVSDRNFREQPMSEIELDGAKEWLRMAINHLIPRLDEYLKDPDKAEFFSTCLDDADQYIDHLQPDPDYIAVPVLKYRSASVVNHSLIKDLFETSLQSIARSTGFGYLSADSIDAYHEDGDIYFVPDIDKFTAYVSQYNVFHPSQDMNMADPDIAIEDQMARVNEAFDMVFGESVFVSKDDIFYHKDEFKSGEINICFVVGLKGSGKSSTAASMARNMDNTEHYDLKYIVNNNGRDMSFYFDKGNLAVEFFRGPGAKYYGEFNELKEELKISEDTIADKITNAFVDFAIRYANHHKDQKFIIDGSQLHQYIEPARFRDYAVLIKGTSVVKSMYQNSKKDGEGIGSTLAKTHQYAGEEFKLLKWRNMYKGYIKKDPEYKDDDEPKRNDTKPANISHKRSNDEPEWEFDEIYNIGLRDNYYLIAEAYNAYIMDLKNNEYLIKSALSSMMNEQVLQEADLSRTQFDAKWNKFMTFVDSMIGRFGKVMDKVIGNNRGYLEKHKDIILNQKWGDQEYSHLGDYKLAQQRITSTKIPEFNYATFQQPLRQDGFDAALKQFMTGHTDFKYDPNEKNLAVQFKKYFLALDKGETKGKLSDLNPQELYNYCYNYQDIKTSVQRDREALNRSSKMILQAIEREARRAGENVNANNAEPGGNVKPTVSTKEQTITENTKLTEDRSLWQSITEADKAATAPATAKQATTSLTNNAPKTNEVDKTNNNQVKTDLKVENDKSKNNVKTPDEEIAMMSNKWITMCRAYCAGKMTAIQQISKDYMALIKNHVTSYTNAQAGGAAQDTGTAQPQQTQQQQPDQNAKAGQNWLNR